MDEERGEDGALLRTPDLYRSATVQNPEWAEKPEMQRPGGYGPRVGEDGKPRKAVLSASCQSSG